MKNILIIGGSYFAGRVFVEELVKQPDLVIYVFNRGRRGLNMAGVTELRGDREYSGQIRAAIPALEWEAVIDFCAYTPSHVEILLKSLSGVIRHYILISTTTVFRKSWMLPIAEEGPRLTGPQPDLGAYGNYGYDKVLAEATAQEICLQSGIALSILRPAIIYGFYNYAPRESYFFDLLLNRQPIVIPSEDLALYSFIWVVDMARMIIGCIGNEQTHGRVFSLASDELISYSRIVQVLEEITGKSINVIRLSTAEIERQGVSLPFPLDEHLIYSGTKIQQLLGFSYTPFRKGMHDALKYYLMAKKQKNEFSVS